VLDSEKHFLYGIVNLLQLVKKINFNHGDIYIMSDKAVGNDWKKRKIHTLRHAAGFEQNLK